MYFHLSNSQGGGNKREMGDLTPNLLHKINEEGGKIYEINKRGRQKNFEEGAK